MRNARHGGTRGGALIALAVLALASSRAALAQDAAAPAAASGTAGLGLRGGLADEPAAVQADGLARLDNLTSADAPDEPSPPRGSGTGVRKATTAPASPALRGVIDPATRVDVRTPPAAEAVPEEARLARELARRRALAGGDPYAPLGLRLGGLTFLPAAEVSAGYDSNADRTTRGRGSALLRGAVELGVASDWSRHQLTGFLRGGYDYFPSASGADRPAGEGRLALRVDARSDLVLDAEAHGRLDTQRVGAVELPVAVTERPLVASYGGSAGGTWTAGRVGLGLRGTVERTAYEDARLPGGRVLDQGDRNVTQLGAALRGTVEATPGVRPYLEVRGDTRVTDRARDNAGFARSSNGAGVLVGSSFEITRLLTGEVGVGYGARFYEDRRLPAQDGPIAEASLVWTATGLTTVTLRGASRLVETTLPGITGANERGVGVEVAHALRRNLILTGRLGYASLAYDGVRLREDLATAGLALEWRLNRQLAVRASYNYERASGIGTSRDYDAHAVLLGVRVRP